MYRNVWDHVLMTQCDVHWSDFLFCGNPIFASEILTGCSPNPMFPWATNPHAKCWQYLIQILCHSNSVGILHPNICWLHQSLFLWMESQCRRVKILKSHVCWHVLKSLVQNLYQNRCLTHVTSPCGEKSCCCLKSHKSQWIFLDSQLVYHDISYHSSPVDQKNRLFQPTYPIETVVHSSKFLFNLILSIRFLSL